ncbi:hypothetical protein Bca4012_029538 [Brassica carinata]
MVLSQLGFPALSFCFFSYQITLSLQTIDTVRRFERYGSEFTYYDYNEPEDLPLELKHWFNIIVADPPYLSKECLERVTQTVSFMASPVDSLLLLLTEMCKDIWRLRYWVFGLACLKPHHSSKLGNEFRLFVSYDPGTRLGGLEEEDS